VHASARSRATCAAALGATAALAVPSAHSAAAGEAQLDEHAGCSVAVTRYNKLGDSGLLVSELVSTLAAAFIIQSPSAPLG
jgi:hypothetical protein